MARLEIRKISGVRTQDLNGQPLVIGRSSANPLQLRHSNVSRKHCVIEQTDGRILLRDLESHVGTTVNGERVTERELKPGDRIMVGPYELIVVDEDHVPAAAGAPAVDIAALRNEINQAKSETESSRQLVSSLEQSLEKLRGELDAAEHHAAGRQQELTGVREELQTVLSEWQTEQESHDQTRAGIRLQQEMIESLESQVANVNEELESLRSSQQRDGDQSQQLVQSLQQTIQQSQLEIEQLQQTRAELLNRLREHEHSQQHALQHASQTQQAWRSLRGQMSALDGLAAQLNTVQQRVEKAETQWVEADRVLSESPEHAPQALVARQRQTRISEQLESLHRERDETVGQLCSQMQELLAKAGRQEPETANGSNGAAPTEPTRGGLFSRFRIRKAIPNS